VREEGVSGGAGPKGSGRPGPRRVVRSETGGYAPDLETRLVREHPSRARPRVRAPGATNRGGDLVHDLHDLHGRPRSRWRPLVGVLVAVVGYVLVAIPAMIAYDRGIDGYGYLCQTGPGVEADLACIGDPAPATEAFADLVVMVTVPAALGILVAWPRRRGLVLLVLACAGLGLYTCLVLANPRT